MAYRKIAIATGLIVSVLASGEVLAASQNHSPGANHSPQSEQIAQQIRVPTGAFQNSDWYVYLNVENDTYVYYGSSKNSDNALELFGAYISGSPERRIFTWYNGDYEYQVAWRPNDPTVIRLQVFAPNGSEILNELLDQDWDV